MAKIDVKSVVDMILGESRQELNESSAELNRLKSLVQEIEKAERSGKKEALTHIWNALYHFNDSNAFSTHIEKYKKSI